MKKKNRKKRLALVVPRAGQAVTGGAESFCLTAARDLAAEHDVEILTSCAQEYRTWVNVYPEGPDDVDGIPLKRFRVDKPREPVYFDQLSARFRYRLAGLSSSEQEQWLREQGPYSTALLRYIWEHREKYDAFIFFTYLYATTYFGMPLVEDRAYLIPLAHDEWPIYLPAWSGLFQIPLGMVFVSPEERDFVRRRFPSSDTQGPICYVPVRSPQRKGDAEAFRREYGIRDPFLLYVGRLDGSKGCLELCDLVHEYRKTQSEKGLHLVLAGPGELKLPKRDYIHALGYVDETTKWNALTACSAFAMPSRNESLCIALLEAWAAEKPAIVNGESPVLVGQCRRANGGLWYNNQKTFNAVVDILMVEAGNAIGRQGREFFERHYANGNVRDAFRELLSLPAFQAIV